MNRLSQFNWSSRRTVLERAALTAGLMTFFIVGYFSVGFLGDTTNARELVLPLDEKIPFVAHSIWVYLWMFPTSMGPLFIIRCPQLFRRTAFAYATVITSAFVCFTIFPVTAVHLRVDNATLNTTNISQWAVSILYLIDPPYNLFPSLHISMVVLAAFSTWKAVKSFGAAILVSVVLVSISVCTVKQHFVLDVLGGMALAAFACQVFLRPYQSPNGSATTYSWRGPTLYLVFLVLIYVGIYAIYIWTS